MITPETVIACAIRQPVVMDQLGEALRSDIVTANPFYREIVAFADSFLMQKRKLPGDGDWDVWLASLESGMLRDGTKEALGRIQSVDTSGYDPSFFGEHVIKDLQRAAAQVARARINENPSIEPEALIAIAEKVAAVKGGALQGLARLSDIDIWSHAVREEELVGTGFPTLNSLIGGWGKELWILFADSGVGKSILLQNFAVNAAVRGKHVLHVTLELGLRPQIQRYYRQIAEAPRADFVTKEGEMKDRLRHWFKLAHGSVHLLEFAAHELNVEELARVIARATRILPTLDSGRPAEHFDMLVLDYLDLMAPSSKKGGGSKGGAYEDLGHLTHAVRALTGKFDMTVLTASQSVRRPEKSGRLSVRDMGDSYHKVRGADGLISLVQTEEELEMHQGRLGLLKIRDYGGSGREVGLYINRDLALIQELHHPNTIQLMKRLGHLPGVIAQAAQKPAAAPGGLIVRS